MHSTIPDKDQVSTLPAAGCHVRICKSTTTAHVIISDFARQQYWVYSLGPHLSPALHLPAYIECYHLPPPHHHLCV